MYIYSSVAGGAKSFFYYTYGKDLNGRRINPGGFAAYQPALWERTVKTREEIASLERVLLFGKHTTTPERTFDVYYGRWIYGDKVYVVALNSFQFGQPPVGGGEETNGGRRAISVPLPEGTQGPARPLFNRGNDLSFADGTLSGTLDSVSVQVYELDYTAPVVLNGGFENDFQHWQPEGDAEVITEGDTKVLRARSTRNSASVTTDITHRILPGQTYTLSADLKSATSTSGVTAFVQVRDYRDEIIYTESLAALTPTFENQTLTFTAPEEFGSVIVGVWRDETGSGEAWVDNLRVSNNEETSSPTDQVAAIEWEAEAFTSRSIQSDAPSSNWEVLTGRSTYQGSGYVGTLFSKIGKASGLTEGARLDYTFDVDSEATYQLWVRRLARGVGSNSAYFGLDGVALTSVDNGEEDFSRWVWVKVGQRALSAGQHTLQLVRREDGYLVDAFLLTTEQENPNQPNSLSAFGSKITGTKLPEASPFSSLYPNPVTDGKLYVRAHQSTSLQQVVVLSVEGKQLLREYAHGQGHVAVDVSPLPPGLYVVNTHTSSGVEVDKILVE